MSYRDGKDEGAQIRRGCKVAFGCALMLAFLFVIAMPYSAAMLWLELNSWGF